MNNQMNCTERIEEVFHALPLKEKKIAELILKAPDDVLKMSIYDISETCRTSVSSVVRLCKRLGYSGYKELFRVLTNETTNANNHEYEYKEIRFGDNEQDIFFNTCLGNIKVIERNMSVMNLDEFKRAVDLLCRAKRIDFYGFGTAGLVANDFRDKFIRINKYANSSSDSHNQMLSITGLTPKDAVVLISYSGETIDLIELAKHLKEKHVPIISLTRSGENTISQMSDIKLYNSGTESVVRIAAMSSRIAQMVVMDALFTAVCNRLYPSIKPFIDQKQEYSFSKHTDNYL